MTFANNNIHNGGWWFHYKPQPKIALNHDQKILQKIITNSYQIIFSKCTHISHITKISTCDKGLLIYTTNKPRQLVKS